MDPSEPLSPMAGRPLVIGVVGGIASGKSTVARLLAGPDGVVLDADRAAHEALRSPEVVARVRERFGDEVLTGDGLPDRAALARVVFSDPDARAALEGWIHPVVRERLWAALEDASRRGLPRVVLDVPLLVENDERHGLLAACDHVVFVDAPLADRDERATKTRGWAPGEVARREAAQLPLAEKRDHATHVIDNDKGPDELERAALALLESL